MSIPQFEANGCGGGMAEIQVLAEVHRGMSSYCTTIQPLHCWEAREQECSLGCAKLSFDLEKQS